MIQALIQNQKTQIASEGSGDPTDRPVEVDRVRVDIVPQ